MVENRSTQELEADVSLNYTRYKAEPHDRNAKGKLISPLAEIFENRMNQALQQIYKRVGSKALEGMGVE